MSCDFFSNELLGSHPNRLSFGVNVYLWTARSIGAGRCTWVSTKAPGQFITYTVPVHQPGNYLVRVGTRTSPNKGKFQLAINEVKVGAVQDEYSPTIDNGFLDLGSHHNRARQRAELVAMF